MPTFPLKPLPILSLLSSLLSLLLLVTPARAGQVLSQGTFTDRDGKKHVWQINTAHMLLWDDKPFVPVGGRFQARSWTPRPTDADFQADVVSLKLLKQYGVMDLYIQPSRGGLTGVPPAAVQRLLDYLDQEGFTYGISINDGPSEILSGYDVRPGKYRSPAPPDGGMVRFPVDTLTSALFFLVSESGLEVLRQGEADMVAEGARVEVAAHPGKFVLFLLPRKAYFSSNSIGVPNLWDGFDNYRDTLMLRLRQIRPGKGFRFFLDPLPADLHLSDAFNSFVPTGDAFTREWADWLARRYRSIDGLQRAWRLTDRQLRDFRTAAQLLPLWGGGKGVEYLYNQLNGERYRVATVGSEFWKDLTAFKTESIRGYMNDLASVLKQTVADVPVVYRTGGYSPLLTVLPASRGFDGIGISAYGQGAELVTRSAGYAYAHAAEAPKTIWLPVVGTADAAPGSKLTPGYGSRNAMHQDLDWLRDIGARGFYLDALRAVDPREKGLDLSARPEQLEWLASYATVLAATGVTSLDRLPVTLFYPRSLGIETAYLRPLSDGGWWIPSERPGVFYEFGPCGKAYALSDMDGGVVYYLWNPAGRRTIHLRVPKAATLPDAPPMRWSASAQGSVRKGILTLTVGPDPIRLENFPTIPVPTEAFEELTEEVTRFLEMLRQQKSLDTGRFETQLGGIKLRYNKDTPIFALQEIIKLRSEARAMVQPYAWLEAELARAHSFDTVSTRIGASGNQLLTVEERLPGSPQASAFFTVQVRLQGTFTIWVASSPDASFSFRTNGQPLLDQAALPTRVGAAFADGMLVWHRYGVATLPRGNHVIEVRANGPALLDAILVTQGEFTPNGPTPPPVLTGENGQD